MIVLEIIKKYHYPFQSHERFVSSYFEISTSCLRSSDFYMINVFIIRNTLRTTQRICEARSVKTCLA